MTNFAVTPSVAGVLSSINALYSFFCGRSVKSLVPLDVLSLLGNDRFFNFLNVILAEISLLKGKTLNEYLSLNSLLQQFSLQDNNFFSSIEILDEKSIYPRLKLLDFTLAQLLLARLKYKKSLVLSINLHKDRRTSQLNSQSLFQYLSPRSKFEDIQSVLNKCLDDIITVFTLCDRSDTNTSLLESQKKNLKQQLYRIFSKLNEEYNIRFNLFTKRLDVTISGFLWSKKLEDQETRLEVYTIIQSFINQKENLDGARVFWGDILLSGMGALQAQYGKSQTHIVPCSLRRILIGPVQCRGGVPEGYSVEKVRKDVREANLALRKSQSYVNKRERYVTYGRRR